jgi:nicotinamide riboside transporter PnuC
LVDIVAVVLYYLKDVKFIALEFAIFLVLSIIGFRKWQEHYKNNTKLNAV